MHPICFLQFSVEDFLQSKFVNGCYLVFNSRKGLRLIFFSCESSVMSMQFPFYSEAVGGSWIGGFSIIVEFYLLADIQVV